MKKITLFISILAIALVSCNKASYTLDGSFAESTYDGKTVYIYHEKEDSIGTVKREIIDSAAIKDKKFTVKGTALDEPAMGLITVGKFEDMIGYDDTAFPPVNFIIEAGTIKFSYDKSKIELGGTPMNDQLNKIYEQISKVLTVRNEMIEAGKSGEEAEMEYHQRVEPITKDLQAITYDFTKANINNRVGEFYFKASLGMFTKEQINELVQMADSAFQNQQQVKTFIEAINRVIPQEGMPYQDVKLMDAQGNAIPLSDYVGKSKVVLVDFWASWCAPCIQEMPALVKLYSTYKSKGLEIVGISVDDDKTKWLDAIKTHKMNWVQLADATTEASEIYAVQSIPHTILIDGSGMIVAKNLRGKQLEDRIAELLK